MSLSGLVRNRITWSTFHCIAWTVVSVVVGSRGPAGLEFVGSLMMLAISVFILVIDVVSWRKNYQKQVHNPGGWPRSES